MTDNITPIIALRKAHERIKELQAELKAKEEVIKLYGYHLMTCMAYEPEREGSCTCGFEQALKGETNET